MDDEREYALGNFNMMRNVQTLFVLIRNTLKLF